jgi:hypothetical protein
MTSTSPNQEAWVKLFEKHRIVEHVDETGSFTITADQIKTFREPRLMTKFDHAYHLPPIFLHHNISILPLTRGTYALGRFDIFHTSEINKAPLKNMTLTSHFETLDFDHITSESTAISCAYVSGILESFLGEDITPTISGRMSSDRFRFEIASAGNITRQIDVDRAQIEIDAGFESKESFNLIEAKNHFSDDFVIRQLYYPYRKWQAAIQKPVRNIFLTYSNGVFELREYIFLRLHDYNSIKLVQCQKYAICNFQINIQSIQDMLNRAKPENEPVGIPFPQADSFDRVINLCELLASEECLSKAAITENYGFNKRQTDYYTNACQYLGLADAQAQGFVLTPKAREIFQQHIQWRRKFFIEQLLKRRVFKEALALYFDQVALPSGDQLVAIMRQAQLPGIHSEITLGRRASTVRAWIDWIAAQIEDL